LSETVVALERPGYLISTEPARLDLARIHSFLTASYWAAGISRGLVEKSIRHSLPFGLYSTASDSPVQIGFARVVSDYATFAYLADVYIETEWRGKKLSKWLLDCILAHPELKGVRRFCLCTRDAQTLYAQFGFRNLPHPENWMEIKLENPYRP
jgi:GNAT superfamily N-acetyltransferase